jgi:hypothetical protein
MRVAGWPNQFLSQQERPTHRHGVPAAPAIRVSSKGGMVVRAAGTTSPHRRRPQKPATTELRVIHHGGPVVDGGGRNPHRLAQLDDLGHGPLRKPRLGLFEELCALGAAQHDFDLMLAEPVLPREAIDPDPSVGGSDDAHHRRRPGVGRQPEAAHLLRHQHRVRERRQQRFEYRDVHLNHATFVSWLSSQRGERTERGVSTGDVLGNPGAGLHRRPVGVPIVDPARSRLHGQRRRVATAQRSALTEIRDANDAKPGTQRHQCRHVEANPVQRPRRRSVDE